MQLAIFRKVLWRYLRKNPCPVVEPPTPSSVYFTLCSGKPSTFLSLSLFNLTWQILTSFKEQNVLLIFNIMPSEVPSDFIKTHKQGTSYKKSEYSWLQRSTHWMILWLPNQVLKCINTACLGTSRASSVHGHGPSRPMCCVSSIQGLASWQAEEEVVTSL